MPSIQSSTEGLLGSLFERAQDAIFALSSCLPCTPETSVLKLNGRNFQIVKLLGEGGFSFVYLVKDQNSGRLFALKKIRCSSYGADSFQEAMKEIEATKRFRSPHIIPIYDSCVVQDDAGSGTLFGNLPSSDPDGGGGRGGDGGKVIYLFLPFYEKGNLQDAINAHVVRGTRFGEREMLQLFLGTCKAVREMHHYRLPNVGATRRGAGASSIPRMEVSPPDDPFSDSQAAEAPLISDGVDADDDGGNDASYPPKPNKGKARDLGGDGDTVEQSALDGGVEQGGAGQLLPYAHRDIKPGNVMVADDGKTPILMDFGSTIKARVHIKTRREAVAHQDMAAERSSMPYRAPELFDVPTETTLTESVDIWSLGCLLYALAYLHSPFETTQTIEQGGSIALAVLNGSYKTPPSSEDPYSEKTREIIKRCIQVKPDERPDVDAVIELTQAALRGLE
ncbi:likely protein kinase [Pseudozyma hubeiensis SY62]|uniref:non-specific serine/threonine protein kinase n=1 Tax=Pseudozyma hubeiensis (strain SY62) TaxID=1305764 RepID=R9P0G7_PSEHS|nr:likely protein kinase [Pseudozyma hubeiensis SY62]GAC94527.1 likely protein kinase [Pseudozyma hubeiensis SY62]